MLISIGFFYYFEGCIFMWVFVNKGKLVLDLFLYVVNVFNIVFKNCLVIEDF